MLEWLAFPLILAGAAAIPKRSPNDKKKIKMIFENTRYGIPNKKGDMQIPKFKKKIPIIDGEETIGTRYLYMIPLGLPATKMADLEKNVGFFTDGLGRPVLVEFKAVLAPVDFKKYLTISVFNKDIPNLYPYKDVPDMKGWLTPLGRTLETTIWHDFEKIPHMTVAGTTRFGKTVFLKVMVTYLIEHHPDDVELYIIDLKGGLEFGRYQTLRQVKGVSSNPQEAFELLREIHVQMQSDYILFRKNYWTNISNTPIKKRRFVIVDEAAQLAPEKWMKKKEKDLLGACQWLLGEITRIGGGLGYREIFCTQYPTSDTLPRSIKQNSDGKITFRLPSGYASDVAIDETGAEKLPSDIKGRGLYKTHEIKEMQVPLLEDKEMWQRLTAFQIKKGETENVIEHGKEEETPRGDFVQFGDNEVRNKRTNPKASQTGNRPKRPQSPKPNEGIPSNSEPRREERLLPKRKGKGTGRGRNGN